MHPSLEIARTSSLISGILNSHPVAVSVRSRTVGIMSGVVWSLPLTLIVGFGITVLPHSSLTV